MNSTPDDGDLYRSPPKLPVPQDVREAVRTLIRWAGDDPDREGLLETPERVARAWAEYAAGYQQDPAYHLSRTFHEVGGYDAMQQILKSSQRPTAVFAANDLMAIGAMRAIKEVSLRIPEDIAIVGIDNIPAANLVLPALTTVNPFPERKGQRAAEVLFQILTGTYPVSGQHEEIPHQLIVRDSA